MATLIGFDGYSGTGKSSVALAVHQALSEGLTSRWVKASAQFGLGRLRELLFTHRNEYGIDDVSYRHLQQVFFRQYWQHMISPYLESADVFIIDNPCFTEIGLESIYRGEDFEYRIDLVVAMSCDVSLIPNRIATRKHGNYPVDSEVYVSDGIADKGMQAFRLFAEAKPEVLSVDTTRTSVSEAANIVLSECQRRFGWNVASLCE